MHRSRRPGMAGMCALGERTARCRAGIISVRTGITGIVIASGMLRLQRECFPEARLGRIPRGSEGVG